MFPMKQLQETAPKKSAWKISALEQMKKQRKCPEFSLTMEFHKNNMELKNHMFYSLKIPWSKKYVTGRVLSRNATK